MKQVSFVGPICLYRGSRDLDEAVVEAETVPDGVLPSLLVLAVVRKQVDDQLVDLAQRAHLHAPTFRSQTTLGPKLQNWWYTNCIHFWWFDSPVKSGGYKLQHATTTGLANLHFGVLNPCPSQTTKFGCRSSTTNFGVGVPPLTEFQETIFGWTKNLNC